MMGNIIYLSLIFIVKKIFQFFYHVWI